MPVVFFKKVTISKPHARESSLSCGPVFFHSKADLATSLPK